MNRRIVITTILLIFGGSLLARWMFFVPSEDIVAGRSATEQPARIVSLAPSITETLFALGLGDRVVGVTRYCDYPPAALEKTEVGGFLDPSYEAIVALEPDLVVILTIHDEATTRLDSLGIESLTVEHRTLDGILDSFRIAGERCGAANEAAALLAECTDAMERIREKTDGLDRPRVLLSSARELGTGRLETVYAAGKNQWYDDLIEMAGGTNAFTNEGIQFPALSGEGLLRLNPDVVLELAPELGQASYTREDLLREWAVMKDMNAVKTGRVYILGGDHLPIPGPRFVQTLEDMARAIHPDLDWDAP